MNYDVAISMTLNPPRNIEPIAKLNFCYDIEFHIDTEFHGDTEFNELSMSDSVSPSDTEFHGLSLNLMATSTETQCLLTLIFNVFTFHSEGNCADEVQVLAIILCKRSRLETFIPDFPLLLSWMLLRLFCKAGPGMELVEDGALP